MQDVTRGGMQGFGALSLYVSPRLEQPGLCYGLGGLSWVLSDCWQTVSCCLEFSDARAPKKTRSNGEALHYNAVVGGKKPALGRCLIENRRMVGKGAHCLDECKQGDLKL